VQNYRPRLLLLIVAYNAESTLCQVLDRIPAEVLLSYDCEVLVIDDASTDGTFELGQAYRKQRPDLPLTVLRNDENQGYGGNQKVGYLYGIEEGFDIVALIHGDGQYAPEELPGLLEPVAERRADAVFGSRMLTPGAARRGGMPLYKFVGNKILSKIQNVLSGTQLSEWHSGYRIYSMRELARLRFLNNSNGFSFDTEVITQLVSAKSRIVELPIPTYYGDEICRVEGLRYAAQVLASCLRHALHRLHVRPARALMPKSSGNLQYDAKVEFDSSHSEALKRIKADGRVLDLGAGPGVLASAIADRASAVATADLYPPVIHDPRVRAFTADLNEPLTLPVEDYDQLLLLDVIEHLRDPEQFLEDLCHRVGNSPKELILTTPNVAFLGTRLMLLFGQFNYGETGILDRTHTRLFTRSSLRRVVTDAGFDIVEEIGIPAPFVKVVRSQWLAKTMSRTHRALIQVAPRLFAYQLLVVARNRRTTAHVLATTRASAYVEAA
jgi:glycosyltransferase involved in cell wall biosynthesis